MTAVEFDPARLSEYLRGAFPGEAGPLTLARISGGQSNPTFYCDWGSRRMVLRKQPPGELLRGAHAIDREYRVMSALAETDVPVPSLLAYEDDARVIGTPFYLMTRLEGRVFQPYGLPDLRRADRTPALLSMARTLARLHSVNPHSVGLSDFGRTGDYFARQFSRWSRQYEASAGPRLPDLDALQAWLEVNLPADDGKGAIAHGDFRMGNMMLHPTEPRVIAVLDWELSTLGHPLADLGFASMAWFSAPDEYGGLLGLDLEAEGLPSHHDFVAAYTEAAPPTAPLRPFHIAFAMFRFAVIFVGIADRARSGSAAGENAALLAPMAAAFAHRGRDIAGI
ncbi:phosphotransferase family protein [Tropicimonas sp. S265A]|uniref:phosphotransferase family protein n=1 Tax=Tropicimonas sp. S265A TaxID=3415134 RepID=UPI003C7DDF93